MTWEDILKDPEFQSLGAPEKEKVLRGYFSENVDADPEFQAEAARDPSVRDQVWAGMYETIAPPKTPKSEEPSFLRDVVGQTAKDVGGVITKAGSGLVAGATLGAYNPEAGTVGIPFTGIKKKIAPGVPESLEEAGVSPDIAENPYIAPWMSWFGTAAPWTRISRGVSALFRPAADVVPFAAQPAAEATKSILRAGTKELARRTATSVTTGAIVGAAEVKDVPYSQAIAERLFNDEEVPREELAADKVWQTVKADLVSAGETAAFAGVLHLGFEAVFAAARYLPPVVRSRYVDQIRQDLTELLFRKGAAETPEQAAKMAEQFMASKASRMEKPPKVRDLRANLRTVREELKKTPPRETEVKGPAEVEAQMRAEAEGEVSKQEFIEGERAKLEAEQQAEPTPPGRQWTAAGVQKELGVGFNEAARIAAERNEKIRIEKAKAGVDPAQPAGSEVPPPFVERREKPSVGPRERRKNLELRKKIEEMTSQERGEALMYDELTGLKSRRAFDEEADQKPVKVALDAHGLKWINDNIGHEAGDELLREVADAIHQSDEEGYRMGGSSDELVIQADTPEAAERAIEKIKGILSQATIEATLPDGTTRTFQGITISHGSGGTLDEAFEALNADKRAAVERGERSAERGGRPGKLVEVPAKGDEAAGGKEPEAVAPAVTWKKAAIVPTREGVKAVPIEEKPPAPPAIAKKAWYINADDRPVFTTAADAKGYRGPYTKREVSELTGTDVSYLDESIIGKPIHTPDYPAKKTPEEVSHPLMHPPPGDRWKADRGAMPGEPSYFLDGEADEDAKGVLIERISEQGTSSWDGYIKDWNGMSLPVADRLTFEEAAKKVEERVDSGTIEAGEGGSDAPVLEGTAGGESGTLPSRPSGVDEEGGDVGAVPRKPRGSGDRDGKETKKRRPRGRSGGGTGDRLPVSEGEGGTGGPVEPEVLEDVAPAVAAADEEFGITPGKTDYVLTPEDVDFKGRGAKTRTRDNITAIKLAMQLNEEGRLATPEEQKTLVRYSGWGGLSDAFHGANYTADWMDLRRELYDLLDTETYSSARDSILNAHYTSLEVVDAMWSAIKAAGFKGGRVLEPGAGIGNFLMRTPMDVKAKTRFTAVELDMLSGTILKQLNQSHDVRIQGYQETALSDNFYDLAISNVPFVETPILSDPRFTRQRFVLHDYYFAKTLDKVRPGGIIAFITSRYTMDKKDAKIREYIAGKADLLGAIRLPRTAFKANAATEVVTDIIFLKRRAEGTPAAGPAWKDLKEFKRGENSAGVNAYYAEHPENILGNEKFTGSMYSENEYTVEPADENLGEAIRHNAERFTAGAYEPRKIDYGAKKKADRAEIQLEGISAIPESSFLIKDGKVYQRQADKLVERASSPATVKKYRQFIDLGAAARNLVTNQLDSEYTDEQFNKDRGALNRLYDAATKNNVRLGHKTNQAFFGEDPNWNLIRALEYFDTDSKTVRKADILTKRVVQPNRKVDSASSPRDALLITLRETGEISLPRIAELLGTNETEAWKAIQGDAFQTPEGTLEVRDKYLSGNVRKKLREAEAAAKIDPRFESNVEALKAVIPEDVPPGDIYVNFGAPWIAPEYIDDFMREVLEETGTTTTFFAGTGLWGIERSRGYRSSSNVALLQSTYGTNRMDAIDILQLALNQQSPKIYDTFIEDGVEKRVINAPATLEAKQRQGELKSRFQKWVWEDEARTKILHRSYNDNFNSFVEPKHDGVKVYNVDGKVQVPGQNTNITLRDTQINAMWRALTEGNTLLWHEVGTGKTFIIAALAMELRRTGAAQKPMIVVPKVIFGQIQQNFMTLFPNAKVLAPSADDFKPANRKRFLFRIATGDWDAVVVTKEHFQKIPPPADVEEELINEALDELERAIVAEQSKGGSGRRRSPTLRQLIKLRDRLKEQLKNLANVKRDEETLSFDQIGVDYLMVDESHYFKNLRYTTRMNGVAGMGNPAGNKRSWDLYVKTTYLNRMTKNRGVVLSTGTPISNSIAELYTIQRYLSPDLLKELDIAAFDSWAATFASVETGYEITVDGGYKAKERFSDFNNMPELSRMVRQVADTVTAQMAGVKRPTAERITVEAPASQEYLDYQDQISKRADAIKARQVDPRIDNFPKLSTDGRHAAVDIRLRVPSAPDHPDSKVNKLVQNVYDEWVKGKEGRLTQLVFLDLGVETVKAKKKKPADEEGAAPATVEAIRTYTDIKQKLLKRGIPAGELALIQDKKYDSEEGRLALYDAVNEGKVRILIGSTSKMSEGMNVQKRLVALHHMDPTWTPMGIMQREGRILRQGNGNDDVRIYTYLTTGRGGKASFDAFMWQLMEAKAGPISELQTNATPSRTMGDVSGVVLNAAEWKALSTGNPLVVEKVKLQDELNRLNALAGQHQSAQMNIPLQIERIKGDMKYDENILQRVEQDLATLAAHPDKDTITLGGKKFDVTGGEGQKERMEALSKALDAIRKKILDTPAALSIADAEQQMRKVGEYRGFDIKAAHRMVKDKGEDLHIVDIEMQLLSSGFGFAGMDSTLKEGGAEGLRFRNMVDRAASQITPEAIEKIKAQIEKQLAGADALRKELGKPFKDAKRLKEVSDRLAEVDRELGITQERAEDSLNAAIAQEEVLLDEETAPGEPEEPPPGITMDVLGFQQVYEATAQLVERLARRHGRKATAPGNVEIRRRKPDLGLLRAYLQSPRLLPGKARFYVIHGKNAARKQDRLRTLVGEKMDEIFGNLTLQEVGPGGEIVDRTPELVSDFASLLWLGDAEGTDFSREDLEGMLKGSPYKDQLIRAYEAQRKFHGQAWRLLHSHRAQYGANTGRLKGHIPHFFETWNVYEMVEPEIPEGVEVPEEGVDLEEGKILGTFRSLKEASLFIEPMAKANPDAQYRIRAKAFRMPDTLLGKSVLKDSSYVKLAENLEKKLELTPEEAKEIRGEVARRVNRHRFLGNLRQRTGQTGFRQDDIYDILKGYYDSVARYIALDDFKMRVVPKFEKDFGASLGQADKALRDRTMAQEIQRYIQDVNGAPGQIEELLDASVKAAFGDVVRSDRPTIWAVNKMLHVTGTLKLGLFNLSSGMVNLTQLVNSFAKLPSLHMAWALKEAANPSPTSLGVLRRVGVSSDLGLANTGGYSITHKGGTVTRAGMVFFNAAERFNRRVTALAAYRHARKDLRLSEKPARAFARQAVDETQFDYSVADTPRIFRNPAGRLFGQFKPFAVKQLEFITHLRGAEHIKFWIPMLLLAGFMGIPLVEGASEIIEWMTGTDPILETKRFMMTWAGSDPTKRFIARMGMYGVLSSLGIDISRRVGTGDIAPRRFRDLLGPTINTIAQAKTLMEKPDATEFVRNLAPSVGNFLTALETASNEMDVQDPWRRNRLRYKASAGEVATKAVGLRPLRESELSDVARISQYQERKRTVLQRKIIDGIIEAAKEGDVEATKALLEQAGHKGINLTEEQLVNEVLQKSIPEADRMLLNTPIMELPEMMRLHEYVGEQ